MKNKITSAAVGIIDDKTNDLYLCRRLNEPFKGKLAMAGGKLDPGELPIEAAIRETKEETGLDVDFFDIFYAGVNKEDTFAECHVFFTYIKKQTPQDCEPGKHSPWTRYSQKQILDIEETEFIPGLKDTIIHFFKDS